MELPIYTYGYAYHMFNTLNAIAMIRQSELYPAIIKTMALSVGVYYACKMALSQRDGEWRQYILKIIGMCFVINLLLMKSVTMVVHDNISKKILPVGNIPVVFALPIGMVEKFGHLVTMAFEQAFTAVGGSSSFDYYNYGTVFGARLAKEVMHAKVRNPEYIANMNNFIKRCVVLPAMIGQQFTKEELVATTDMWGLVSTKAGTFTRVPMTIGGVKQNPSPTCREAVPYFEKKMSESLLTDITDFSINLNTAGRGVEVNPSHHALNNALRENISTLYAGSSSVESVLKHNMMINSMHQYRLGKYASAKAFLNHEANGFLAGDLGNKVLTGMLSISKCLLYSSFLFVVPLMLLSGGIARFKGWIAACLSLQLWPPLFAVLNMIIDLAYDPVQIVSYSAWSTELERMDSIASMASGVTLLIPILALHVTRMGEGGMMQLAGNLMGAAQGAASSAASEAASGGRSYDNESISNKSYGNVNANKFDDSRQYVSGTNSGINSDGSMEKVLPNGNVITTGGAGATASVGEARYSENEGVSSALHEGQRSEVQAMHSSQSALSKSQESLISKEASALSTIAENTRTDNGYNIDTSTDEGRELVKGLNTIDELTKSNGYSWQQNAEAHLKGDLTAGGKVDKSIPGKVAKALGSSIAAFLGIEAGVGGSVSASNGSEQQDGSSSRVNRDLNTSDRNGVSTKTNNNAAYLESLGIDKSQQDSMRESYNETQRLEQNVSAHKDNVEAYNQALDYNHTQGSEFSQDVTQDVIDAYRNQYKVSDADAAKAVLNGSSKARAVFNNLSRHKANQVLSQVRATGHRINSQDMAGEFAKEHENTINKNTGGEGGVVDAFAKENNMTNNREATQKINDEQKRLKQKHDDTYSDQASQYEDANSYNEDVEYTRSKQIEKLEKDRIGNGLVGTLGGSIDGVGRKKEEPIPMFEPIMSRYGNPEMINNVDDYQNVTQPSNGKQEFNNKKAPNIIIVKSIK